MDPIIIAMIVFACSFGSVLLAMYLRSALPEHHIDAESKDAVRVGIGLVATMTALVLGLVNATAKSSFDAVDSAVKQSATEILALDRLLARYGPETAQIRKGLRDAVGARIEVIWPQDSSRPANLDALASGEWLLETERLTDAIHDLQPQNDSQRALQKRAQDLAEALLQARWLVTDNTGASIPLLFLVVLTFWLVITFASFGLLAPCNATVIAALCVCALCVGGAVFLVLELDGPFDGLLQVSAAPVRYAHAHLNQ